jgi:uncharacterized protein (DUF1684 family)
MGLSELDLLDWKRRISELYAEIRAATDPESAWKMWRAERDELFTTHGQSPVPEVERPTFKYLPYFGYDPAARVLGEVEPAPREAIQIGTSGGQPYEFTRVAKVGFELHGVAAELDLYWLENYGGGLFLPFRDATAGTETYGAGRYLLDTVKGADLGTAPDGRLILDFNFAYNPSCSYDPHWVCPLAPPANHLSFPIEAGERAS